MLKPTPVPTTSIESTAIEVMIVQQVANSLAAYEDNRNNTSRKSGCGSDIHGNDRGGPRVYTYKDFMNCKSMSFYDNEGVVGLTRWINGIELVFHINFYVEDTQVKFVTCISMDVALTRSNDHGH